MLLRKFKGTGPDVIVLIFIIMVMIWIGSFVHPELPSSLGFDIKPMPLFGLLLKVAGFNPLTSVLVTFLLVLLTSFLLVNFNTSEFFLSERTFLPALFYVLLSGLFPEQQILNPALPAALFLILSIRKIMDSYKIQDTAFSFFDAGLIISTGSLFYANFVWFGLLLVIGIALLRTGNVREIIISVLGLATPWFITFGFYYVSGEDLKSLLSVITFNLFTKAPELSLSGIKIASLIITSTILLMSIFYLYSVINSKKIKSRKTFRLLIWAFLIAAGVFLLFKPVSEEILWLAAVPTSYLLTHYFVFVRQRVIPEILFSVLFILIAMIQIAERV